MKICISAVASGLDAQVDPRFGRCQYFTIVDTDTMEFESVENANIAASGGAGIQSAQFIANKGVEVMLTGNVGPNAYTTLQAAGVNIITGVSGTVREVVEAYKSGRFGAPTSGPTVDAHSGMGGGMGSGRGIGRGMGMGRGMGAGIMPAAGSAPQSTSPEQEIEALKAQSQMLAQQLSEIQLRIEKLEGKGG